MYEIKVSVSFAKHTIFKKDSGVMEGDYNTTKLVFEFDEDVSDKTITFGMSNPNGELVMLQELPANHEIVLTGEDDEGHPCSLFGVAGLYPFTLTMMGEDSRIVSTPGWLTVNKNPVDEGGVPFGGYFPTLIQVLTELQDKVDKEVGKGLSTNDYTNVDRNKLAGIEAGAEKNKVTGPGLCSTSDCIYLDFNTTADIDGRNVPALKSLSVETLDYAVKSAMCDGIGAKWEASYQFAAKERMGIDFYTLAKETVFDGSSPVISFNFDNPIKLKSFMLYIEIPQVSVAKSSQILITRANVSGNIAVGAIGSLSQSTSGVRYTRSLIRLYKGQSFDFNFGGVANLADGATNLFGFVGTNSNISYDDITSVKYINNNSINFPVGTKVKLYVEGAFDSENSGT